MQRAVRVHPRLGTQRRAHHGEDVQDAVVLEVRIQHERRIAPRLAAVVRLRADHEPLGTVLSAEPRGPEPPLLRDGNAPVHCETPVFGVLDGLLDALLHGPAVHPVAEHLRREILGRGVHLDCRGIHLQLRHRPDGGDLRLPLGLCHRSPHSQGNGGKRNLSCRHHFSFITSDLSVITTGAS